ncbi:unnamed protein product [Rotaria socialis]|uniref:Uncharacterized protein n=1 Tax=Rotaria socialis TaxID=392032 RepID=A0A817V562_9BILA|nr:unnamed protein product [Rotaria socialis]
MIFKRLYVGSGSYTIENRGQISRLLKQEYAKPTLAQYESQESLASSALSFVEQSISALVDTLTKYGDESHSTSDKPRTSVTSLNTTVGSDVLELLSARKQYEILPYQDLQLELTAALNLFNCIDENRVIALDASYGGISTFTAFQRRRVPSKLLFFTDENHWVLNPCNSLVWYQEVLD